MKIQKIVNHEDELVIDFQLNTLIIQPISSCNFNCSYCYLPNRDKKHVMSVSTASKLAEELSLIEYDNTISIIWHSGEPLLCGLNNFLQLLNPFEELRAQKKIRHSIQTNGSLINDEWCELFLKYNFAVGVSIDGPRDFTNNRVDWKGQEVFERIINGINILKRNNVGFGIICVVTQKSIPFAKELYNYFVKLGCKSAGFSIVEEEGINKNLLLDNDIDTTIFWLDLFDAWHDNPSVHVREFRRAGVWLESELNDKKSRSIMKDILPTVGFNGDVVLISPEFLDIKPDNLVYSNFIAGNIHDTSLLKIIDHGFNSIHIKDYITGIANCSKECEYFNYCRGGDASNKYFESGRLDITRTNHCKNTRMHLVDAILQKL